MSAPSKPIVLYWFPLSGHSHRVQLALALMGLPHEIRLIDLKTGQHKTPEFLAINPQGKLPAIDDDGTVIYDSNAILAYLALKYDATGQWFPRDPVTAAEIVRHLSFAAGPVEFSAADARLVNVFGAKIDQANTSRIEQKWFPIFDAELAGKTFLVGDRPTIADVANYTYVAHAPEGGIDLEPYPNIRAWLARVEALPGFVPMQRTAVGLQTAA